MTWDNAVKKIATVGLQLSSDTCRSHKAAALERYAIVGGPLHSGGMARRADMTSSTTHDVKVVEVSQADGFTMFDQVTRREMGISGEEFLCRWDAGEYEGIDYDTVPGLVEVWMYLPFAR
jgi:hypothetical protein